MRVSEARRPASAPEHPARWGQLEADGRVLCTLCPRYCRMHDGQAGFCFIRRNRGGELVTIGYGRTTGFAVDPIEKKPLNHFLPGTRILSFGTAGCNLGCKFCQNWNISKARTDDMNSVTIAPEDVVALARERDCPSIAYTYNDPVIFAEYVIDVSRAARAAGIRNVAVTAGYIAPEARSEFYRYIDAANVDLKGFTEGFYHRLTLSHLEPVLDTLLWLRHESNVWLEITTLLIPDHNDGDEELRAECDWIAENLGPDVPLHFTAFHPDYRLTGVPRTPLATVQRARRIAREAGLHYVYVGNVLDPEGQSTCCPGCGALLVRRGWHDVSLCRIEMGQCFDCGRRIPGVFDS